MDVARNVIGGNRWGVYLSGGDHTTVVGNYIGIGPDGSSDFGNTDYGVYISGAASNTIGTTEYGQAILTSGGNLGAPRGAAIAANGQARRFSVIIPVK